MEKGKTQWVNLEKRATMTDNMGLPGYFTGISARSLCNEFLRLALEER